MSHIAIRPFEREILRIAKDAGRGQLGMVLILSLRDSKADDEVESFMNLNPGADIDTIADYIISFAPPIEYVDEE